MEIHMTSDDILRAIGIVVTLGSMAGFAVWYNRKLDEWKRLHLDEGYTSFEVVGGVLATILGAGVLLAILTNIETAALACGVFGLCFAATGLPMIAGDVHRHNERRLNDRSADKE